MRDYCAVPDLIATLQDDENAVRAKTAFSLGRIGDRRAVPALLEKLNTDPERVEGVPLLWYQVTCPG
jgi:HEAT repeat protein